MELIVKLSTLGMVFVEVRAVPCSMVFVRAGIILWGYVLAE